MTEATTEPRRRLITDTKRQTYMTMLVDMTGSMEPLKQETIGACNEYLSGLKKDVETQDFKARVDVFNSDIGVAPLQPGFIWLAVKDAPVLSVDNYEPAGMTPLYDAIMETILAVEKAKRKRDAALVVIQTDGGNNASRTYTREQVAAVIKRHQDDDGWQFVFLGCGVDAMAMGGMLNIAGGNTLAYSRDLGQTVATMRTLGQATAFYARSGSVRSDSYFAGSQGDTRPPRRRRGSSGQR